LRAPLDEAFEVREQHEPHATDPLRGEHTAIDPPPDGSRRDTGECRCLADADCETFPFDLNQP
jgi:hypothetical protein